MTPTVQFVDRCPTCDHDLGGLVSADSRYVTCPECGSAIDLKSPALRTPPRSGAALISRMSIPLALLIAAGWMTLWIDPVSAMGLVFAAFPLAFVLAFGLPPMIAHRTLRARSRRARPWRTLWPLLLAAMVLNSLLLLTAGWPLLHIVVRGFSSY